MKKIAILQSNYSPWKGYFDLIASVDQFILFDDMQYTRRDWRNRNKIKTAQGDKWLTVPVQAKGKYYQLIRDTKIDGDSWAKSHWHLLKQNYQKAPFYEEMSQWLKPIYLNNSYTHLSELNMAFIFSICDYLGINTIISKSSDYDLIEGKTERLSDLCLQVEATEYVSGPAAKGYIQEDAFKDSGINLSWFDYDNYPEYPQLWGEFTHHVTILDLLFNCGKESKHFMRHVIK